jgi:branched-chain amino acid transport system substrate-binding protein
VTIGISFPLSGSELASAGPARDGALLAISQFRLPGYIIKTKVLDHAVNGIHDPQLGASDMAALVADPTVVGVIGPFNSSVAKVQIPIGNAAGLLQCSPSNTNPDITKGAPGQQLRAANPTKTNYIRVSTSDDFQGAALAQYAFNTLKLRSVAIIDDTETYGHGIADTFAAEWTRLGGRVVGRESAPRGTTDYTAILATFAASSPDAVFFGGVTSTGGGLVRKQMEQNVLDPAKVAYLGGDGIQDGSGSYDGSFIGTAGAAAANSYSSVAAIHDIPGASAFAAKYRAAYNMDPGAYSAPGFACAQVILAAIQEAAAQGDVTREAVRVAATNTSTTFQTVLGPLGFDAVGDTSLKVISIYKVDLTVGGGMGDWMFADQINVK